MFLPVGEVAPALPGLLEPLLALLFFAVALGVLSLISYIVYGIVKILEATVGKIPGVGGIISGVAGTVQSILSNALGSAIATIDADIAFWWHELSRELDWLGQQIAEAAAVAAALGSIATGRPNAQARAWINAAIATAEAGLLHAIHAVGRRVRSIEHEIAHATTGPIGKAIHAVTQPIEGELRTLEGWTYPKVGALEGELGKVIEPDIQALKDRATTIENQAIRLYQDAAGVYHAVNIDELAAAMALGLGALGLGGLRCTTLGNVLGARGCGLWSGVDDLLGLLVDVLLISSLCDVLPWLTAGVDEIGLGLVATIHAAGLSACGDSYPPPPAMPAVTLSLPSVHGVDLALAHG